VTTVVETSTTVVCPYATTTVSGGVTTSTILTTTYVCPSAGTYTIAPVTTVVSKETIWVYPTVASYPPRLLQRRQLPPTRRLRRHRHPPHPLHHQPVAIPEDSEPLARNGPSLTPRSPALAARMPPLSRQKSNRLLQQDTVPFESMPLSAPASRPSALPVRHTA
jgi:hypothetical protein